MVGIMFEFEINNDKWQIEEKSKEELKELYEAEMEEKAYFVFGVTIKSQHVIYINKDMCEEQKIKTLKHELTHCYIWEYGLYNVIDVNEEVICDLVACSNDFINEVVEQYLGIKKLYICDAKKNLKCTKKGCYLNNGECMHTSNQKYAKRFNNEH